MPPCVQTDSITLFKIVIVKALMLPAVASPAAALTTPPETVGSVQPVPLSEFVFSHAGSPAVRLAVPVPPPTAAWFAKRVAS